MQNIGNKVINIINKIVLPLCVLSVVLYILELSGNTKNSYESHWLYLCLERYLIFPILTIEYFIRWWEDYYYPNNQADLGLGGHTSYPMSYLGIIDLLAWLPSLIGFFVPINYLGLVRSLRILRLLKFFRYSKSLQLGAIVFYRSLVYLKTLSLLALIVILFSSCILYQIEPDTFGNKLSNAVWYSLVTSTTVGFGDYYPKTDIGKIVTVVLLFIPSGAIFAGFIGSITATFQKVMDEHNIKV